MAFSIKKYNKGGKFNIDTSALTYKKLKDLYSENSNDAGAIFVIGAVYINTKSKFGENPNVCVMDVDENGEIIPAFMVNLPRHLVDDCKAMLEDEEAVDAIKNCRVGFTIRKYFNKVYKTDAYSVEWVDVE